MKLFLLIVCLTVLLKENSGYTSIVTKTLQFANAGDFPHQVIVQHKGNRDFNTDYLATATLIEFNGQQLIFGRERLAWCSGFPPCEIVAGITTFHNSTANEQKRNLILARINYGRMGDLGYYGTVGWIDEPFDINEFVKPASLPIQDQELDQSVVIVGFNWTDSFSSCNLLFSDTTEVPCTHSNLPPYNTTNFCIQSPIGGIFGDTIISKTDNTLLGIVSSDGIGEYGCVQISKILDKMSIFVNSVGMPGNFWPVNPKPVGNVRIAQPGEVPYNAFLHVDNSYRYSPTDFKHNPLCGGALVEVEGLVLVLTVSSCFGHRDDWKIPTIATVIVGGLHFQISSKSEKILKISKATYIDGSGNFPYDGIIVMFISEDLEITSDVNILKLPNQAAQIQGLMALSGYGTIPINGLPTFSADGHLFVPELMISELPLLDFDICNNKYMSECNDSSRSFGPDIFCLDLPRIPFIDEIVPNATITRAAINMLKGSPIKSLSGGTLAGLRTTTNSGHYGEINREFKKSAF